MPEEIADELYRHLSGRENEGGSLDRKYWQMNQQYFSSGMKHLKY